MAKANPTPTQIDRRLIGAPIQIDGRSVQPVARLHGRLGSGGSPAAGGAGGMLRLDPVELIVRQADGAESTVALPDPTAEALRSMAGAAVAVAVLSIILNVLARLLRRR
jgi:uncharacterized spore protein YtfJ